jgi:hypothetical protein
MKITDFNQWTVETQEKKIILFWLYSEDDASRLEIIQNLWEDKKFA